MAALLLLLLVLFAAGVALHAAKTLRAARACERWPRVPGRILSSGLDETDVTLDAGLRLHRLRLDLEYEYEAGGRRHRGTRLGPGGNEVRHRAAAEKYAAGREVRVAHDPADPARSLLETHQDTTGALATLVAAPLAAIAGIVVLVLVLT